MSESTEISLSQIVNELDLANRIAWYQVDPLSERGQRPRRGIELDMDRGVTS